MKRRFLSFEVHDSGVIEVTHPQHKRIYVSVNAAVFVFVQIDRRFVKLQQLVLEYDQKQKDIAKAPKPGQMNIDLGYERGNEIVALAWELVDWLDRLRKIMSSISGVKKNQPWYRSIRSSLKSAEDIRHIFQHHDSTLPTFVEPNYPLMGSVLAAFPSEGRPYAYVLILVHLQGSRVTSTSPSADSVCRPWLGELLMGLPCPSPTNGATLANPFER